MKMPTMPKLPKWGWILLVLVGLWYVFLREGFKVATTAPPPPPNKMKQA